jgi:hypothetical protein
MFPPGRARLATTPLPDGIAHGADDDRNRGARPLGGERGGRSASHDDFDLEADQFGQQIGKALGLAIGPPVLEDQVSPLDVAEVTHAGQEALDILVA